VNIMQRLVGACPESIEEGNYNGDTPLHVACSNSVQREPIELLANARTVRVRNRTGMLALHSYCLRGTFHAHFSRHFFGSRDGRRRNLDLGTVERLVEMYDESLQVVCEHGCTPLHLTCVSARTGSSVAIAFLVDRYPEALGTQDDFGRTPLEIAC